MPDSPKIITAASTITISTAFGGILLLFLFYFYYNYNNKYITR